MSRAVSRLSRHSKPSHGIARRLMVRWSHGHGCAVSPIARRLMAPRAPDRAIGGEDGIFGPLQHRDARNRKTTLLAHVGSCAQGSGDVVHGVPSGFLVGVDPGWGDEFGDAVGGPDDGPFTSVDGCVMETA